MFYTKRSFELSLVFILEYTGPLYKSLNILNVDQIRDYSIALLMYKLTKLLLPPLFENMFIKTSDVHNCSTRQSDLLYVQCAATKRTHRTLKHYGLKLWNSLYHVVHTDCAINTLNIILCLQFYFHLMFSTLHNALCSCSPFISKIAVEMNLGHISITSAPIVKVDIPLLLFILFAL